MKVSFAAVSLALLSSILLVPSAEAATNYTDADILQFALNLECLEAEFYSWVAYGKGLASVDSSLVGNNSQLTTISSGGQASTFSSTPDGPLALQIATEIAENEISHVRYLRKALTAAGATPVPCPQLSLSPATFLNAATAAVSAAGLTINPSSTFNPYSSAGAFYLGAFIFEDVGVTAYKGAVRSLQSQEYAAAAAGIMAIEAGHAAVIRNQLYSYQEGTANSGLQTNANADISIADAVSGITKLRDNLAGTSAENALTRNTVAQGGATSTTGPDLFAADSDAIAFTRTPSQVLDIVQFSPSTQALAVGGFFPNGPTGNADVLEITGDSTRTCNSGALSMASVSAASVAVMAAVALAM